MHTKTFFFILLSLLIAFLLTMIKFPSWAAWFCPAFVPLLVIYWTIALPHQVSLGTAWFLGILMDVVNGTLLGEHALALVLISYLSLKVYRQFRMFPIWQQAGSVAILIGLYQFILFWIQGLIGQLVDIRLFWLPILTSSLLWPLLQNILRQRHCY